MFLIKGRLSITTETSYHAHFNIFHCLQLLNHSGLTHPDLSEAALPELEVKTEGFSGDLPGILG